MPTTVINTASAASHPVLIELGALPTNYGDDGLAGRVAALAPGSVDAVVDAAGSGSMVDLVDIAGNRDVVVTVADFSAPGAVRVGLLRAENDFTVLAEGGDLGERGAYSPWIVRAFRPDEIVVAHTEADRGHAHGRIVIMLPRPVAPAATPR